MSEDPCHYVGNMWICQCGEFDFSPPLLGSFQKCKPLSNRAFPLSEWSMLYLYFVVYGEGEPWKARVSNEADMVTVRGKRVMEGAFCRRRALCHKRQVRAIGG